MKIRAYFVSNSSSASFIINKADLTKEQLENIRIYDKYIVYNWDTFAEKITYTTLSEIIEEVEDENATSWDKVSVNWELTETEDTIEAWTLVENIDMDLFLKIIGVDMSKVKYETHSKVGEHFKFRKSDLTQNQIESIMMLESYKEIYQNRILDELMEEEPERRERTLLDEICEDWTIYETPKKFEFYTDYKSYKQNTYLYDFLESIGVDLSKAKYKKKFQYY